MIAFTTITSESVPLLEGVCAQICYFGLKIIGGLSSHLLLFFVERQNMMKEKQGA